MINKLATLVLALCAAATAAAATDRPNIVFIFSDDHAPNAISAYGGHLDGRRADPEHRPPRQARARSSPTPSAATRSAARRAPRILTGKHSHINGFLDNNNSTLRRQPDDLPASCSREAGYQTAIIGKWHLVIQPDRLRLLGDPPRPGQLLQPRLHPAGPAAESATRATAPTSSPTARSTGSRTAATRTSRSS